MFQTRKTAGWLAAELSREGHQVALLSGEMMVEQRAAVIERFREGKEKVLVTTNVCARGRTRWNGAREGWKITHTPGQLAGRIYILRCSSWEKLVSLHCVPVGKHRIPCWLPAA